MFDRPIEIGDLRIEEIAHEEILRQPHPAELFEGSDAAGAAHARAYFFPLSRIASVRSRSAFSRMKPAASFWS